MKTLLITLMMVMTILPIFAELSTDLVEQVVFITNLYEDGYFDIALSEIEKIEPRLEYDKLSLQVRLIKADIYIQQKKWIAAKDILTGLHSLSMESALKAQVILSLANIENLLGNYSEANTYINDFITRFSDNERIAEAMQLRGDLYFEQKQYDEAQKIYSDMHRKSKSPATFVNLIKVHTHNGETEQALSLLEELKTTYPRANDEYQQALLAVLTGYEIAGEYEQIVALYPDQITPTTPYTEAIVLKKIAAYIHLKNYLSAQLLLENIKDDVQSVNYYRALLHKERGDDNLALPIFRLLATSEQSTPQIKTMSFFNMVQIIARTNTAEAYEMLQTFLIENPDQQWEGDILYQLGFIEFQRQNYRQAYEYILSALNFRLNNVNHQNALYLKGEIEFLLNNFEYSYQTFSDNLGRIPEVFLDEAIFKLGLNAYFLGRMDKAIEYLNELVTTHPQSQKVGTAYYYLGEIALHRNLSQARQYYTQALSGQMDVGVIYLRIAYVDYKRADYVTALETLNRVPETADYLYDKHLLRGNIYFAQRDYNRALESYRQAERNATDQASVQYIWSLQAWTYYNLKQYDAATTIYRRLAEQSDNPGYYILSAASAAFNADNFDEAKSLYQEYIRDYPDSPELYKAKNGLANCHFNQAQYQDAVNVWQELVTDRQSSIVIEQSLRGLQASYTRMGNLALFSEFLNLAIFRSQNREFCISLYEYKANFEYEQKNYTASLTTINQLIRSYPDKADDPKLKIMLANNYTWLQRYEEADQIYVDLTASTDDPAIYYEWGHIKWAQGDIVAALRRYKRAADNSRVEQYWLTLLERQVESKDSEFMKYYNDFRGFASEYHKALASMYYVDWLINQRNYTEALQVADQVSASDTPLLRANANYKKAEVQYLQQNYDEALTNFLRIRYVFSQFSDLRYRAELYIAKIYLHQGEREKAIEHFESIRSYLSPAQIAEFNAMIN